jgi:hypothetical protein
MHKKSPSDAIEDHGEKKWLHRSLTELVMSGDKRTAAKKEQETRKKVPKRMDEGHPDYILHAGKNCAFAKS